MLERYFIRPETIDRIRASWIKEPIEQYVAWLTERGCAPRTFCHRVPILRQFGEFARARGASTWEALPEHLDAFVSAWVRERARQRGLQEPRPRFASEVRRPIEQMLCLVVPGFTGRGRPRRSATPFHDQVPGFFAALRQECGLREETVRHYGHHLARFEAYLGAHGLRDLRSLSAVIVSGFLTESSPGLAKTSLRDRCGVLRVFLRHLHRERLLPADLSGAVEAPNVYRLAGLPRSITWDEVRHVLEVVDRRTPTGKRDYAMLLLLVTYGLRAREVAALTLDDCDWRRERLRVPERKADHSTAYPLSPLVGAALLDYLQHGRPKTTARHVFFRVVAPVTPLGHAAVSSRAAHYLRKAGVVVPRPGSHILRHTCVQRLVDADFSLKVIGDYVGHRSPASTEIYSKVAIEALRKVALGDGEEVV